MQQDQWHARAASIPQVFAAAAQDMGKPAVDSQVVAAVWQRLLPGEPLTGVGLLDHPCRKFAAYSEVNKRDRWHLKWSKRLTSQGVLNSRLLLLEPCNINLSAIEDLLMPLSCVSLRNDGDV